MPNLQTRMIFISHAWKYNEHYYKIVNWFNDEPNFLWKNCSVPEHDPVQVKINKELEKALLDQIRIAQVVVILSGLYVSHRGWINYEIEEAYRMAKYIIGVKPWGNENLPNIVKEKANTIVSWNRASIISELRKSTYYQDGY